MSWFSCHIIVFSVSHILVVDKTAPWFGDVPTRTKALSDWHQSEIGLFPILLLLKALHLHFYFYVYLRKLLFKMHMRLCW